MSTEHSQAQFRLISARQLSLSPLNVRKTDGEVGIEQLASLIQAEGVLQNLVVYETPEAERKKKATHSVVAGGRRWRAIQLLIKQGRIDPDYLVPSLVVSYERAVQISLAENSGRESMHPADEFEAFKQLIDAGQTVEDVAARFAVSSLVVQRRLRLANVCPTFIALYRQRKVSLEQLMALAATEDHERQQQAWDGLKAYERSPAALRARLTENEVSQKDRLARFVGLKAYEKAGGGVRRDLFAEEDEGAMLDAELLHRLAQAKLEKHAARLKAEGLSWAEVRPEFGYAERAAYGRVRPSYRAPTADEQARLEALEAREDELLAQSEAEEGDEERLRGLRAEMETVSHEIGGLKEQMLVVDAEQQACAGAVVSIDYDGKLHVERDLLRPEDAKRFARARKAEVRGAENTGPRGHSAALLRRLTAHRTLALQATLVQQPMMAVLALTHRLALATFYSVGAARESVVQIEARPAQLAQHGPDLESSPAQQTLEVRRTALQQQLPGTPDELWAWLQQHSGEDAMALLAFCVAVTIDGVRSDEAPTEMEPLAQAAKLDMRSWWQATAASYLTSVPKARIVQVVTEAVSATAAASLEKLKKEPLAAAAEKLLAQTGWLPSVLRTRV